MSAPWALANGSLLVACPPPCRLGPTGRLTSGAGRRNPGLTAWETPARGGQAPIWRRGPILGWPLGWPSAKKDRCSKTEPSASCALAGRGRDYQQVLARDGLLLEVRYFCATSCNLLPSNVKGGLAVTSDSLWVPLRIGHGAHVVDQWRSPEVTTEAYWRASRSQIGQLALRFSAFGSGQLASEVATWR